MIYYDIIETDNRGVAMEKKLDKILYVLVAFTLVFASDYFLLKRIEKNSNEPAFYINDWTEYTTLDLKNTEEFGLYHKYELASDNLEKKSQEWYRLVINSKIVVKFQYSNNEAKTSDFNLYVNDQKIENEEEILNEDKFKLNFYLYGDILVIEHQKADNRLSFVKIINTTTGETRNLSAALDFYITNVLIDFNGITVSYSRQAQKMDSFLSGEKDLIAFTVDGKEVYINPCDKSTWGDQVTQTDYVAFDMKYDFTDNILNLEQPELQNFKTFSDYMNEYTTEFRNVCKN